MRSLGPPRSPSHVSAIPGSQKGFLIPFSLVPAAVDGEPGGRPGVSENRCLSRTTTR